MRILDAADDADADESTVEKEVLDEEFDSRGSNSANYH